MKKNKLKMTNKTKKSFAWLPRHPLKPGTCTVKCLSTLGSSEARIRRSSGGKKARKKPEQNRGKTGEKPEKTGEHRGKQGKTGKNLGKTRETRGNRGKTGEKPGKPGETGEKPRENRGQTGENRGKPGKNRGKPGKNHGKTTKSGEKPEKTGKIPMEQHDSTPRKHHSETANPNITATQTSHFHETLRLCSEITVFSLQVYDVLRLPRKMTFVTFLKTSKIVTLPSVWNDFDHFHSHTLSSKSTFYLRHVTKTELFKPPCNCKSQWNNAMKTGENRGKTGENRGRPGENRRKTKEKPGKNEENRKKKRNRRGHHGACVCVFCIFQFFW